MFVKLLTVSWYLVNAQSLLPPNKEDILRLYLSTKVLKISIHKTRGHLSDVPCDLKLKPDLREKEGERRIPAEGSPWGPEAEGKRKEETVRECQGVGGAGGAGGEA